MKKTVLAFAVAAAMGVPAVAAADTTLYGRFNVSLDNVSDGDNRSTQLASNSSRIGVRGSEDLGMGLRGVFQMEAQIDAGGGAANSFGDSTLAGRNTYLGLAGDFGEVRLGRHDTAYKLSTLRLNLMPDTIADMHHIFSKTSLTLGDINLATTFGPEITPAATPDNDPVTNTVGSNLFDRPTNNIVYISPSFEGFQAMANVVTRLGDDRPGTRTDAQAYSLGLTYTNGPLFVAGGYENRRNLGAFNGLVNFEDDNVNETDVGFSGDWNAQAYKLGAAYTIDDLTLIAGVESYRLRLDASLALDAGEESVRVSDSRTAWTVGARYNIGQAFLAANYMRAGNLFDSDGATQVGLGGGYNFSRRTQVYAVYSRLNNDDDANYSFNSGKGKHVVGDTGETISGFSIGVAHNF